MAASSTADEFLLQLAREAGWVDEEQIRTARAYLDNPPAESSSARSVYQELVRTGAIDAARATRLLAGKFGMRAVDLAQITVAEEVLTLVSRTQAVHYRLLPLARYKDSLEIAIADPLDTDGVDALSHLLRMTIEPGLASWEDISQAIDRLYGRGDADLAVLLADGPALIGGAVTPMALERGEESADADAPIIKRVHAIIAEAVRLRASDIHLEPLERRFRVRYRVDGVLTAGETQPKRLQAAMISRVKIMAGISIAEKRLPQDGRIQFPVDGRTLDLRVSSLPTSHGEGMVMRILDKESVRFGLMELGFSPDDQQTFERLIAQPDGILLVTGPTGSGKTTTLYSCLHALNRSDRKIITVEDPVEYQMSGINQVPVRAEVGMTFAAALRAMLRQAPNIVMVGEIRDRETAEVAINASLTGHLVLSTLHTNDAPGAVTRLVEIGVKPFLVSTSLRGVMAQRLVRKICPDCGEEHRPTALELRQMEIPPTLTATATFRRGRGCCSCHGTGYQGRMGIFEILVMNDELRQLIHSGASASKLREKARVAGMRTLREDGIRKVIAGLTTVEEVVSITTTDAS